LGDCEKKPLSVEHVPVFAQYFVRHVVKPLDQKLIGSERWLWFTFASLILLLTFVAFVLLFVRVVYPRIPEMIGGGEPKQVQLLITEKALAGAQQLGISMDTATPRPSGTQTLLSEPVSMIFEGTNTYAVQLADAQIVQIDKQLVVGMRIVA
jgi:hypothetical protein